jgi:hypothetical protein
MLIAIVIDSFSRNNSLIKAQQKFVNLTKITEPSFSVSSLESRFLFTKKSINRVYPEFPKESKLEFVYDK